MSVEIDRKTAFDRTTLDFPDQIFLRDEVCANLVPERFHLPADRNRNGGRPQLFEVAADEKGQVCMLVAHFAAIDHLGTSLSGRVCAFRVGRTITCDMKKRLFMSVRQIADRFPTQGVVPVRSAGFHPNIDRSAAPSAPSARFCLAAGLPALR
ncbi:MAG TPA: hypothetical protein VFJ18_14505 [Pararhizobium sp.]|nr:hypothetical protein [Pararhizobium sp.]